MRVARAHSCIRCGGPRTGTRYYVGVKENFGVNVARNVGSRIVDGDVQIFLDDDWWFEENLERKTTRSTGRTTT